VSVVCGTTAGVADSKISNRIIRFKSSQVHKKNDDYGTATS